MVEKTIKAILILRGWRGGGLDGNEDVSHMLIFLLGALLGVLLGGTLCVRYLRREIAADIGPRLRKIEFQLDNIEAALNLVITTRYAELATRSSGDPTGPPRFLTGT
jgi:hypothetical protein